MSTTRKATRAKGLGIDDAAYAALLEAQGGHCAICPNTPKTRRLHVDHDHSTGAVRGLLCHRCNRALPTWVAAPWLASAMQYLEDASGMTDSQLYVFHAYVSRLAQERRAADPLYQSQLATGLLVSQGRR